MGDVKPPPLLSPKIYHNQAETGCRKSDGLLLWSGCNLSPVKSMSNSIHNDVVLGSGGSSKGCLGHQGPFFSGVGLVTSRAPVTNEAVCCVNLLIPFFPP